MSKERYSLMAFILILVTVIAVASFASQKQPYVDLHEEEVLPHAQNQFFDIDETECEKAGGDYVSEKITECFDEPAVTDVCGFGGVPCFIDDKGSYCRESKHSFCACESNDECPEGYDCQFPGLMNARCSKE